MLSEVEKKWRAERLAEILRWQETSQYQNFINDRQIWQVLKDNTKPTKRETLEVIEKARENSSSGSLLSPKDVAILANNDDEELWDAIFETAYWIKRHVYGNRIVIFAPLYVSSPCVNKCAYCGFRHSNDKVLKKTLSMEELEAEVRVLINQGHKRLIIVFGEHPVSDVEFISRTIEKIYDTHDKYGEIRRVNINASPLFVEEYERIKRAGIGTYQVFQETYHYDTYCKLHPQNTLKGQYAWRLFALHRALEADIDDVAIGVLFGLYHWRFELLGLLHHAMSLEEEFGIGPHTISYPRMYPAVNTPLTTASPYIVSDADFAKIVAIIRLMCPYTGSILTARERPDVRREVIRKGGVSQIDAGSRIAVGGYVEMAREHIPDKEQFQISDTRSLDDFIFELCKDGYLPSFCTAGYREGRTGANFMPLAKHASVKNFCIANGILTFKEYLQDYASPRTKEIGERLTIPQYLSWLDENVPQLAPQVRANLEMVEQDQRDLHF